MLNKRDWVFFLIVGISLFIITCKIEGEKTSPPTPVDYTGKYVFYNYGDRMEIWKNPEYTFEGIYSYRIYNGTYGGWTIYAQIHGNQIYWSTSSSMDTTVPNGTFIVEGKKLSECQGDAWLHDVGERIESQELWNAIIAYSKDSHSEAETGFKKYLKTDPNDLYAHCRLVECLTQQGKVDEAKSELAKIENNPNTKSDPLNQWMVPRARYCLQGEEKSLTGRNAFDGYRDAQKLFHLPEHLHSMVWEDFQNVDMGRRPLGPKEKESMKTFLRPNLDAIHKFLSLPETKEFYSTDMHYFFAQYFCKSLVYYGMLQADDGKIEEAVDVYRRVIRCGQQMTQGDLITQLIAIAWRSIGEKGFSRFLRENHITQIKDAELVLNTLKELQKQDPISTKETLFQFEPPEISKVGAIGAPTRANVVETGLILLETEAAIKLYFLKTGKYPYTMQELVPEYLSELPVDTFNKNPIKLTNLGLNLVPYSYGPDTTDDHGEIYYDPTNGTISKGDLVFP